MSPEVASFFDSATNTISHIVRDPSSNACAIIDSVLDYDPVSGKRSTESAEKLLQFLTDNSLELQWILETHVHADHLTAAPYIKKQAGGKIAIGNHISSVQQAWNSIFNYKDGLETDPSVFDHLLEDGETFTIGNLSASVMYTPGHTSVDVTYVIGDAAFVGDTLFMPDYGTARADFPGGDARAMYQSIQKILSLPDETRLFMCHDYLPKEGRDDYKWVTTVGEEKNNILVSGRSEEEFVAERQERDKNLATPTLLYASLQVNIRAGELPPPEDNGVRYLKVPVADLDRK